MTDELREEAKYERFPSTPLPESATFLVGASVWAKLQASAESHGEVPLLIIDAYPGVDIDDLIAATASNLQGYSIINIETEAGCSSDQLNRALEPWLTDDPVLGVMSTANIDTFYDPVRLQEIRDRIATTQQPTVLIGWGAATLGVRPHTLVIADLPRWEIQKRQRRGAPNWRAGNHGATPQEKFKRGYFVEWRAADRHKMTILSRTDFLLDTTRTAADATAIDGNGYRAALASLTKRPFRVVPFFDPGVWGGEWMREKFDLEPDAPNYAWCFDCVPEENSLLFHHNLGHFETPAINLVLSHPQELLGDAVWKRFGAEFPIRFDMLDTIGGQNLSLQVHPMTDYIRDKFGMSYTQDESYYILDATENSVVYLGVKKNINHEAMDQDLRKASRGEVRFPAEDYVNQIPVKKHDHISIPAGTVHCSGADTMVLEISATPYIFTFKLWDWDRVDLNGRPRPLHLDDGLANIQWNRDTSWVMDNLITRAQLNPEIEEVVDEKTGLHSLEFLETRRCWFTDTAPLHTHSTVTVMTLVEGDQIVIRSPQGRFSDFPLRYGETVILPAGLGDYVLTRTPESQAKRFATIRAWVRDAKEPPNQPPAPLKTKIGWNDEPSN